MFKIDIRKDTLKLENILREHPDKVADLIAAIALEGERDVKQSFGTSPSQPGDPPGVDTGALRASINVADGETRFQKSIRTGVDYDAYLEFGTEGGERIAPRPYMLPMAERLRRGIPDMAEDFLL